MITVRNCGIVGWIIKKLLALVQLTLGSFNPGLPYSMRRKNYLFNDPCHKALYLGLLGSSDYVTPFFYCIVFAQCSV